MIYRALVSKQNWAVFHERVLVRLFMVKLRASDNGSGFQEVYRNLPQLRIDLAEGVAFIGNRVNVKQVGWQRNLGCERGSRLVQFPLKPFQILKCGLLSLPEMLNRNASD